VTTDAWKENNPAGRLFETLTRFNTAGHALGAGSLCQVWVRVFALREDDVDALFLALADVRQLFTEYRGAVEASALNPSWFGQDLPAIAALLNARNLDADWRGYVGSVSDGILRTLAHAAHELSTKTTEARLTTEELQRVREALDGAYASVESLGLDPAAQKSLCSALDAMQSALARYRTLGIQAFWHEWLRALRDVIATEERAQADTSNDKSRWQPARRAFALFMQAATRATSGADTITKIGGAYETLNKWLGDGAANV
jgi:hypothetical protein